MNEVKRMGGVLIVYGSEVFQKLNFGIITFYAEFKRNFKLISWHKYDSLKNFMKSKLFVYYSTRNY